MSYSMVQKSPSQTSEKQQEVLIYFDPAVAVTFFGALRILEILLGVVVIICVSAATDTPKGQGFVYFVAVFSLANSFIVMLMYMLHVPENMDKLPWIFAEMLYTSVWTLLYFIAGCIAAAGAAQWAPYTSTSNTQSAMGAAAFFCFVALVIYGINFFVFFQDWRTTSDPPTPPNVEAPSTYPSPPASPSQKGVYSPKDPSMITYAS